MHQKCNRKEAKFALIYKSPQQDGGLSLMVKSFMNIWLKPIIMNSDDYFHYFMGLFSETRYRWERIEISMAHNLRQSPLHYNTIW